MPPGKVRIIADDPEAKIQYDWKDAGVGRTEQNADRWPHAIIAYRDGRVAVASTEKAPHYRDQTVTLQLRPAHSMAEAYICAQSPKVSLICVDGVASPGAVAPVSAGRHRVSVMYWDELRSGTVTSKDNVSVTFSAQAGHIYIIQSELDPVRFSVKFRLADWQTVMAPPQKWETQ